MPDSEQMEEQRPLLGGDSQAQDRSADLEAGLGGPGLDEDDGGGGEDAHEHTAATWKEWLGEKLESKALHKTVISLIVIDASCVLADLVYTFLSESCVPSEGEDAPAWLAVLSRVSLAITTFFLVEIPLNTYAFGVRYYLPGSRVPLASLHCFDAVVIVTTFVLEVILRGKEQELVGLLIVFRLWRLVKLVEGFVVGSGELSEEMSKELADAKHLLREKDEVIQHLQNENNSLRQRLAPPDNPDAS